MSNLLLGLVTTGNSPRLCTDIVILKIQPRCDLGSKTSYRYILQGLVAGSLRFQTDEGVWVDCSLAAEAGEPVPQDPEALAAITTAARNGDSFFKNIVFRIWWYRHSLCTVLLLRSICIMQPASCRFCIKVVFMQR
jgi:hypothetical protein